MSFYSKFKVWTKGSLILKAPTHRSPCSIIISTQSNHLSRNWLYRYNHSIIESCFHSNIFSNQNNIIFRFLFENGVTLRTLAVWQQVFTKIVRI